MAKKEEKNQAEIYREERKARIAKANKKNAKKGANNAGKLIKRIVAVVIVLAIVCGAGYYVIDNTGLKNKMITAVEIGDTKVDSATYYYYYYMAYQQALSTQENYESYGWTYIDSSISPDEQDSPYTDDDNNPIKWDAQLMKLAETRAQSTIANYNEAVKAGMTLDEAENTEIEETIAQFKESASNNGYSVNAYLKSMFGFGLKDLEEQLKMEQLASKFQAQKQEELTSAITDDDLKAELKENPNNYGNATIRYYSFLFDTLTKNDGESDKDFEARQQAANKDVIAQAKEVFADVNSEDSMIEAVNAYEAKKSEEDKKDENEKEEESKDSTTLLKKAAYSKISGVIEESGADWAFSTDRKAGDKKLIEGEKGAYIVYVVSAKSLDAHSVTVRYCLVPYNSEHTKFNNETERTEAKDTATKLYNEWKADKNKSEETFANLCIENSADTSTSSDGGLLELRLGQVVSAFEDWTFDASRKVGDCEVIEAEEYGYFIIYFSSNNKDDLDWKNTAKDTLADKAYEGFYETLLADDGAYVVTSHEKAESAISKDFCKKIKRNAALSARY